VSAFIRLVLRNALRNRRRTLLTVTSVAISIFLLVSLQTLLTEIKGETLMSRQSERRLLTRSATSLAIVLPVADKQILQRIPGVELVSEYQWIPTYYKRPNIPLIMIAIDPISMGTDPDIVTDPREIDAFRLDRQAVLLPRKFAQKNGLKNGDRITFPGTVFPFTMEFTVRGTFVTAAQNMMFCHYSYFNGLLRQHLPSRADWSMAFIMRVASPEVAPQIAKEIDATFSNSPHPTRTETEKNFILGFASMLGNVRLFISMIAMAVIFAIALVTTNTMSMAIRERAHEIAMMKAMGFTPRAVVGMIVAESLAVAGGGGILGVVSATLFFKTFDIYDLTNGVIQHFQITTVAVEQGIALAIGMAVISSVIPATRGAMRPIAASLRQIG
jgi:putative ABC transport system permease protein